MKILKGVPVLRRTFLPAVYLLLGLWAIVVLCILNRHSTKFLSNKIHSLSERKIGIEPNKVLPNRIYEVERTQRSPEPVSRTVETSPSKNNVEVSNFTHLRPTERENLPTLLVWKTSNFMMQSYERMLEFVTDEECGLCRVTTNRSALNESIAVLLYNHNELIETLDIPDPKTRNSKQVYVFWSRETQSKTFYYKSSLQHPLFDPIFNLTMAFTRNSDIRRYFGSYRLALEASKSQKFTSDKNSSLMKRKKKLAIWIVSNCYHLSGSVQRMIYAKSLVKAGLKLDKFGACFEGKRNRQIKLTSVVSQYKFYLAFENSLHCPDYVTEKFWRNSLEAGLVPVVWGPTKEDLLAVAPPNSFIHTEDFKTPEALIKYLNYLDRNDTAYLEYHKWRDVPLESLPPDDHSRGHQQEFCRLCRRLLLENHPPQTYPSISKWFYETGYVDDKCLRPFVNLNKEEQAKLVDF